MSAIQPGDWIAPQWRWNARVAIILASITLGAAALRLTIALTLPTIHHSDEIFQILEPAHRLAFGTGIETWEWRLGVRSWFLPAVFAIVMRIMESIASGPQGYLTAIAILMSLASLSVVIVGGLLGARLFGAVGAVVTGALCAIWYDCVYYAPATLSEAISAHVLIVAAYAGWLAWHTPSRGRYAFVGVLLGLTICIRFQTGPAAAFAAIYLCRADLRQRWLPLIAGASVPLAGLAILDWMTLGLPLQSIWWNFWVNVVEGRSRFYGVSPWYWYLFKFIVVSRVTAAAIGVLLILYARRFPLFVGMVAVHLVAHSIVPHKELRFLFPVVPLAVVVAGLGTADLLTRLVPSGWSRWRVAAIACATVLGWASLSLASGLGEGFRAHWGRQAETLRVMEDLGSQPDFCGLAVTGVGWNLNGGYTYLHSSAQVSLIVDASDLKEAAPAFNYAIVARPLVPQFDGFRIGKCWSSGPGDYDYEPLPDQCLLQRPGSCQAVPKFEFSTVLKRWGF